MQYLSSKKGARHLFEDLLNIDQFVWYQTPAFGVASAPARRIFRRGLDTECGRNSPLRKTTSAAYGVGHHSIANGTAVGARCRPSSHRLLNWGFCPVKRGRTRHTRFGILCDVELLLRRWLFGRCRGRGHGQHRRQIPSEEKGTLFFSSRRTLRSWPAAHPMRESALLDGACHASNFSSAVLPI